MILILIMQYIGLGHRFIIDRQKNGILSYMIYVVFQDGQKNLLIV